MNRRSFFLYFSFLIYSIGGAVLYVVAKRYTFEYDDGGLGSFLLLGEPIWGFPLLVRS